MWRVSQLQISDNVKTAADWIRAGRVVALPTDTFYALGADALNQDAVQSVCDMKGRSALTPLPVLIPSVEYVWNFAKSMPPMASRLAEKFWPGALIIVMPALDEVPTNVRGGMSTVGLRVPDHPLALELLHEFDGGIIGTSANETMEPPMKSATEVQAVFGTHNGLILDGECGGHELASTAVDITQGTPVILRHGPITRDDIEAALGP